MLMELSKYTETILQRVPNLLLFLAYLLCRFAVIYIRVQSILFYALLILLTAKEFMIMRLHSLFS